MSVSYNPDWAHTSLYLSVITHTKHTLLHNWLFGWPGNWLTNKIGLIKHTWVLRVLVCQYMRFYFAKQTLIQHHIPLPTRQNMYVCKLINCSILFDICFFFPKWLISKGWTFKWLISKGWIFRWLTNKGWTFRWLISKGWTFRWLISKGWTFRWLTNVLVRGEH